MWRVIDMRNKGWTEEDYEGVDEDDYDDRGCEKLNSMCRRAIDLSQGQLVDINIEYFGNNNLFFHLTQGAPQLRRLRIAACFGIKGKYLVNNIVKFPLLQELHLFDMRTKVSAGNIEAIGRSCPTLQSFTFDHKGFSELILSDGVAFAVAKSMPGLLHLRLFRNQLTNKGLQAILDGCPLLESLDLRKCFNVVLEGDLEKRCSRLIKGLKRPLDSADDEWVHHSFGEHADWEEGRLNYDYFQYQENNDHDIYCFNDPISSDSGSDCFNDPDLKADYYYDPDLDFD